MTYGVECWPFRKQHMQIMRVTEIRMLRWMCGIIKKDGIGNELIQEQLEVASTCDKLRGSFEMLWYIFNASQQRRHYGKVSLYRLMAPQGKWIGRRGVDGSSKDRSKEVQLIRGFGPGD